jgi:hypothetical protein
VYETGLDRLRIAFIVFFTGRISWRNGASKDSIAMMMTNASDSAKLDS